MDDINGWIVAILNR